MEIDNFTANCEGLDGGEIMQTKQSRAAGHTPGPWKAHEPDGDFHDVIRIYADIETKNAIPIAVCPQRLSAILAIVKRETNETTEAAYNARLIAAAPDLAAALKAAKYALLNATSVGEMSEEKKAIDAALSKAGAL